jgi:transcription elongation GreA/GreB family factor
LLHAPVRDTLTFPQGGGNVSRAFVKEDDDARPEVVPEIPVSTAPNLVTARGLRLIEARIAEAEAGLAAQPDEAQTARLRRDLRYWQLRHATARLTAPDPSDPAVQFGSRVTYRNEEGETRTVTLTGEDEADPTAGTIAYAAPVARALTGATAGSSVTVQLRGRPVELEVLSVEIPSADG